MGGVKFRWTQRGFLSSHDWTRMNGNPSFLRKQRNKINKNRGTKRSTKTKEDKDELDERGGQDL